MNSLISTTQLKILKRNKKPSKLQKKGITILPIPYKNDKGELSRIYIPLGAEAFHNGRSIPVPFVRGNKGKQLTYERAIEELEFEITNAVRKLQQDTLKTVGFTRTWRTWSIRLARLFQIAL